jgi:hypothetical protein
LELRFCTMLTEGDTWVIFYRDAYDRIGRPLA